MIIIIYAYFLDKSLEIKFQGLFINFTNKINFKKNKYNYGKYWNIKINLHNKVNAVSICETIR